MAEKYSYAELEKGHIRILHIQPHLDKSLLQGSLQTTALQDAKDTFYALSWTWGEKPKAENYQQITIDGQLFSVRPNLWDMLNAFRKRNESLSLWIDAICINQDESKPEEMNRQIPMMAGIYKGAREVYIWLGASADDSDYVMETIRSNTEEAYTSPRFITGLLEIFRRPWWSRTWILQEYVLNRKSPKVFCGQAPCVSAELMLKIWRRKATQDMVSQVEPDFSKLQGLGTIYWLHSLRDSRYNPDGVHLGRNLRNALLWLKGFQATEPRDKIYGALGLIEAEHQEKFVDKVGVHTDKAAEKVYLDATIYLLECEKSSTIFYDFPVGPHNGLDAPSWVPNFNLDIASVIKSSVRLGDVTSDHLDTPREDINISNDHLTMSVRGRILDRVMKRIVVGDETIPGWDSYNELEICLRMPHLLHKIRDLVCQSQGLHPSEQQFNEPLWKTLIAGCYGSIESEDLKDEVGCQQRFDELMAIPLDNFSMIPQGVSLRDLIFQALLTSPSDVRRYNHLFRFLKKFSEEPHILQMIRRTLTTGRIVFAGEGGYYGISEAGTLEGDLIVLLFPDHFVPFILRERGESYEMVGVAYLPEPTKDAAVTEIKQDRKLLKSFDIV